MIKYLLILLQFVVINSLSSQLDVTTSFEWHHDTLNGEYFGKTSMHIPVKFSGDTSTYYFQFDTGANKSYVYTGGEKDSTLFSTIAKEGDIESNIGRLNLIKRNTSQAYRKNGKKYIGTIGSDFLRDKIVVIDFVKDSISFVTDYDSSKYSLAPLSLRSGRPVLEIKSQGEKFYFLFDTGSSLFELWTTKKNWRKWSEKEGEVKDYPIRSWGKINTAYRKELSEKVFLTLCPHLRIGSVWYNSNRKFARLFREIGVSGIIGNKPFLNNVIVMDIKNKRMGVKKCADQ